MANKHPAIPIDRNFEDVLISAVRYALGRQTYMTSVTSEYVSGVLPYLSDRAIHTILRDIEKADDLGNPIIDAPNWIRLAGNICGELEKRKQKEGTMPKLILKPCPFCGDLPVVEYGSGTKKYWIRCKNEKCRIQPTTEAHTHKAAVTREWNRRAEDGK